MSVSSHKIKYTDTKALLVELEFIIACSKVEGNELIKISLQNTDTIDKFRASALRLLKSIKKDGIIQLFVFEDDLASTEKTESVYLLNKFPFLADNETLSPSSVYVKL